MVIVSDNYDLKLPQLETLRRSIAKLERVVSFAADEVHLVHEENIKIAAELEVLR